MKGLSKYITPPFQLMTLEGGISIQVMLLEMIPQSEHYP